MGEEPGSTCGTINSADIAPCTHDPDPEKEY